VSEDLVAASGATLARIGVEEEEYAVFFIEDRITEKELEAMLSWLKRAQSELKKRKKRS
jgi:hypothetical protein